MSTTKPTDQTMSHGKREYLKAHATKPTDPALAAAEEIENRFLLHERERIDMPETHKWELAAIFRKHCGESVNERLRKAVCEVLDGNEWCSLGQPRNRFEQAAHDSLRSALAAAESAPSMEGELAEALRECTGTRHLDREYRQSIMDKADELLARYDAQHSGKEGAR